MRYVGGVKWILWVRCEIIRLLVDIWKGRVIRDTPFAG